MARQRRSERAGNPLRRARGWWGLALAGAALTACSGEAREGFQTGPSGQERLPIVVGGGGGGGSGGGGTGGGSAVPSVLVGVWKNVIVIFLDEDVQTWTTVWRFERARSCRLTRTSFSQLEGFPRTTDRACTFTVQGSEILADFPATSQTMRMPWDLVGVSPDRLRLEGIIYERIE